MKSLRFFGDSLRCLRDFPKDARHDVGFQLYRVQCGLKPLDFKPMTTIGPGVEQIRVRDESGIYRVIYTARFATHVFFLHAFQNTTRRTSNRDLDVARVRFNGLLRLLRESK